MKAPVSDDIWADFMFRNQEIIWKKELSTLVSVIYENSWRFYEMYNTNNKNKINDADGDTIKSWMWYAMLLRY